MNAQRLHVTLLNWLGEEATVDWSRASVDGLNVRAKRGGESTGPNPVDRGKPGLKDHLVVERNGIPLAVRLSAANAHDSTQLLPLIDAIPSIVGPTGKLGRPRKRPAKLHADKSYDSSGLRRALRARNITSRIAHRAIDSSESLGWHRGVVERTQSWLLGCRRLGVRYERRADLLQGLLRLACSLLCLHFLAQSTSESRLRPASTYASSYRIAAVSPGEGSDGDLCPSARNTRWRMDVAEADALAASRGS